MSKIETLEYSWEGKPLKFYRRLPLPILRSYETGQWVGREIDPDAIWADARDVQNCLNLSDDEFVALNGDQYADVLSFTEDIDDEENRQLVFHEDDLTEFLDRVVEYQRQRDRVDALACALAPKKPRGGS